ncbi:MULTISPECIES: HI1506-related protein [Serratia]|uniref:HI1506-related protein n=1 Tax=Serratia TaxID=613 RepID=UPI00069E1A7D|nr:HI1506-related protein [Serratia sp. 506_PEND]
MSDTTEHLVSGHEGADAPVAQDGAVTAPGGTLAGVTVAITCPRETYMRAGIRFTRGRQVLERVAPDVLARLQADPCLIVVPVHPPASAPDEMGSGQQQQAPGADLGGDVSDADILVVIAALPPEAFTQGGAPKVAAVSEALGTAVTKARIDAALAGAQP